MSAGFPVTAAQPAFAAAGGGGAFAKNAMVAAKTKKATRKRKAPRDASTTAREERAAAERKRTRRIAQLIAELRSEVVGEIPTSGLDRISVLDNACLLIGRLRSRVNSLKRAQGMAATAKRSPEGTPDTTPPASPPPFAGGRTLASKALAAGTPSTFPASRAPVRPLPSFASRRDEEDETKQMLARLLAENSMLRRRRRDGDARRSPLGGRRCGRGGGGAAGGVAADLGVWLRGASGARASVRCGGVLRAPALVGVCTAPRCLLCTARLARPGPANPFPTLTLLFPLPRSISWAHPEFGSIIACASQSTVLVWHETDGMRQESSATPTGASGVPLKKPENPELVSAAPRKSHPRVRVGAPVHTVDIRCSG